VTSGAHRWLYGAAVVALFGAALWCFNLWLFHAWVAGGPPSANPEAHWDWSIRFLIAGIASITIALLIVRKTLGGWALWSRPIRNWFKGLIEPEREESGSKYQAGDPSGRDRPSG
jgi:hypothetical protein